MIQNACKPAAAPLETRGPAPVFVGIASRSPRADFQGNAEPSLDEMISDEVVRRVMARDGVAVDQLLSLLDQVRLSLR
ncbi:MAG: hypothetical protein ACM33T_08270 [Solirubrobacterales bacterium]